MSLFERINKKITEEKKNQRDNSYLFDDDKDSSKNKKSNRNKKKFSSSISRTVNPGQQDLPIDFDKTGKEDPVKGVKNTRDIIGNRRKQGRPVGSTNRPKETSPYQQQELPFDDGKKKRSPRKGVDYFFDADKAKKERETFRQGRKAYTDSKSGIKAGKVTDKGVIDYITKARNMKQGTNANTKANREAAKVIAKSSGSEYKEKIRTKYETDKDLPRRRGRNQPSYAEIKKGIDARNPVKPGQFTGKPVPASTPVKKIKTAVTDKEIQDVLKTGRKTKPSKTKKITVGSLDARDKAINDLDDLIIEPKKSDVKQTEKIIKKQRRKETKKITTPKPNEIEQSQKILDKSKPSSEKLFDPTGQKKKKLQQQKVDFNKFMKNLKTKSFVPPKTTPIVTPPKVDPITQPLTEPLKKTRTFKKIKIKAPPKTQTGTFKKIMKFAGKNRNPILKTLGYTAAGAYLLSRTGTGTDNKPKNNPILGNRIKSGSVKPVDIKFTLSGKGGDGFKPAGMKK